jgi:hypothetical protein
MNTNFRNNFTNEFYDAIYYGKCDNIKMVKKYRDTKSNNVICYTNESCNKYNAIIAKRLGITDKFSIGAKVICNTNELRNYNIYNKFTFTVTSIDGDNIVLDTDTKIPRELFDRKDHGKDYISLGYARTLYSVQGESMESFYFPDEDLTYLNNRATYTLISRLKGTFNCEIFEKTV